MVLYVDCAFLNHIMDVAQTILADFMTGESYATFIHDWQLMKKM